jgi:hypothetical protein
MTSVEFESLVNKEDNKLISGKKIIIDEKIFSDIILLKIFRSN